MNTKICRLTGTDRDDEIYALAGEIIRRGGLVAFPTETVYGLGGNALDPEASRKIYAAKGRPSDNPLILHIADFDGLVPLVKEIPDNARRLMNQYWPGPMTLIFEKSDIVPRQTTGGLDTAAVRMPSHEAARRLIRAAGVPVAAPSANLSGKPSPTSAAHVIADMDGRIDMIIDGGDVPIGLESTIVDVTGGEAMILRPGYIGVDAVRRIAGSGRLDPAIVGKPDPDMKPKAPGMKYRHYAPKAEITIVRAENDGLNEAALDGRIEGAAAARQDHTVDPAVIVAAKICSLAREKVAAGFRTRILCAQEHRDLYPRELVKTIGCLSDDGSIAHNLYKCLRDFDLEQVDFVFSEAFDDNALGEAIMNRLTKAAGYHIVTAIPADVREGKGGGDDI